MLPASLSDTALAARVVDGDGVAFAELARRYRSMIHDACGWAPHGLTRADLRQEALIGLLEACKGYEAGRGHAFEKFASTCVYYHAHRARRDAMRLKHQMLTRALWHAIQEDTRQARLGDEAQPVLAVQMAASIGTDPARIVELREELRERVAGRRWREQQARRPRRRELYSDEQIAHALALVEGGKSLHEAAAAVGTTHTTVLRWRRRAA